MPPEETAASTSTSDGVSSTPAPETASAPASGGDDPSSSPAGADTGTPPAAPSTAPEGFKKAPPEFNFDEWDGEDFDALPAPHRPAAERVRGVWEKRYKDLEDGSLTMREKLAEAEEARRIYDSFLVGDPDPRIVEAEERAKSAERQMLERLAEFQDERGKWNEEKKGWESWREEQAKRYAEQYRQRHPEFDKDDGLRKELVRLLKAGWDEEHAADLLTKQPKEVWAEAERLRTEGVPEKHAIQFAVANLEKAKAEAPQPRPGAQITAGATGSGQSSPARADSMATAKSFAQKRNIAIHNSITRARRAAG